VQRISDPPQRRSRSHLAEDRFKCLRSADLELRLAERVARLARSMVIVGGSGRRDN
jgi:hypothetical protein